MSIYCKFCGKELKEGAKFCQNCGKQATSIQIPPVQQQTQQPMQPYQSAMPMQPQKSKTGLIIVIVAIVIVVIIAGIFLIFFMGGGITSGNESDFYGTWETSVGDYFSYEMTFNTDKTLEYGISGYTYEVGTWRVSGNKLIFDISMVGTDLSNEGYDYVFSNGGNKLTLKNNGIDVMTLTKQ